MNGSLGCQPELPATVSEKVATTPSIAFGKNAVRLTGREWAVACLLLTACVACAPALWTRTVPFEIQPDGRVSYALSEDYWTYRQLLTRTVESGRIPVIGDSFAWGEYVPPMATISHYLNAETGSDAFTNVGLNGAHPLALDGLIQNEAGEVANSKVVLHCNLLWMSSAERDLQSDAEGTFNHPRLLPQFYPRIPSYKAPLAKRLGVLVDRAVPFFELVDHVRLSHFEGRDLHTWSLANPYVNPLTRLGSHPIDSSEHSSQDQVSWTHRRIALQDFLWIDLETSLQWSAWRRAAHFLVSKGNAVFAVIGPFNEHLLTEPSLGRYLATKRKVESWLQDEGIAYIAPTLLPSDEYADASHPLKAGYARLAREIVANHAFQKWFNRGQRHADSKPVTSVQTKLSSR